MTRKATVTSVAYEAIRAGWSSPRVVEIVKAVFPDSRISESAVNSYRSRMRAAGEAVPKARTARAAMATRADLAAMEARLAARLDGIAELLRRPGAPED